MSGRGGRRSDYIACTCDIAEVSGITHYSIEICDKLNKMYARRTCSFFRNKNAI